MPMIMQFLQQMPRLRSADNATTRRRLTLRAMVALTLLSLASTAASAPAPAAWSLWDDADPSSTATVDHDAWQALLEAHVETLADGRTIVHYNAFSAADGTQLDNYLAAVTAIDPRSLNRQEQLAYWINLYNALTVDLLLEHPKKQSILRIGGGFLPRGPWDDDITSVAGETLTLNDIEHRILRPLFKDRRIHYAVNCASVGCPNLSPTAYTAANVEAQLAAGERAYLEHPRGLELNNGKLTVSSIFKWYGEDFAADDAGLLAYFASVRPDLADALKTYQGRLSFAYDWSRNDR
ncbi:MAG: DUF547 domain-containing protein [Pseudomonadota bacterium]